MGNSFVDARTCWSLFIAQAVCQCFFREMRGAEQRMHTR